MFLLLSDLQAGQMGEAQLQLVLLFKVLHNTAIIRVSRLHGQGEPVRVREWEGEQHCVLTRAWTYIVHVDS